MAWTKTIKNFYFIIRAAHVFLLGLIIFGSFCVFILTLSQVWFPNAAQSFPSTMVSHYAYNIQNTSCSDPFFQGYLPIRFKSEETGTYTYQYCSWPSQNSWWRALTVIVSFAWAWILIDRLRRRSPASDTAGIWQNPKRVLKILLIACAVMAFDFFLLLIVDSNSVRKSNAWCTSLQGKTTATDAYQVIECDYYPFTLVALLDVTLLLLWGGVIGLIPVRIKCFNKYSQLEDEDEYDLGELAPKFRSSKKKGRK